MTEILAPEHLPLWSKRTAENLLDFGKNTWSMVFGQNLKNLTSTKSDTI